MSIYCENCGTEMENANRFCPACGSKAPDLTGLLQEVNKAPEYPRYEHPSKKKLYILISLIFCFLVSCISPVLREYFSDLSDELSDYYTEKDMDRYIENTINAYTPGTLTDTSYESDFWGFRFDINSDWQMFTDDELQKNSEDLRISGIHNVNQKLKKVDPSLLNKWRETYYAKNEMGAYYLQDGTYIGEINFLVFSSYGFDDSVFNDAYETTKTAFESTGADVLSEGTQILAGESYKTMKGKVSQDDVNFYSHLFMREKDGFICTMWCKYLEGYESAFDVMLQQITPCS